MNEVSMEALLSRVEEDEEGPKQPTKEAEELRNEEVKEDVSGRLLMDSSDDVPNEEVS